MTVPEPIEYKTGDVVINIDGEKWVCSDNVKKPKSLTYNPFVVLREKIDTGVKNES